MAILLKSCHACEVSGRKEVFGEGSNPVNQMAG